MKLAFSTLGCPEWNLEQIMETARANGFTGIEVRGIEGAMEPEGIVCLQPANRENTLQAMKEHGLAFCVFGTSVHFHDPETVEQDYQKALEIMRF